MVVYSEPLVLPNLTFLFDKLAGFFAKNRNSLKNDINSTIEGFDKKPAFATRPIVGWRTN